MISHTLPFFDALKFLFFAALSLFASGASSGQLDVSPTKLFFEAGSKTNSLTLTNKGPRPITIQIEAKEWTQEESGKDQYSPTSDIIFFPKIFTIDAGDRRVVRVGYQGVPPTTVEKPYRLYMQELPVDEPGVVTMKFILRVSIPLFVPLLESRIEWMIASAEASQSGVKLRINNTGNQHITVGTMTVVGRNQAGEEVFSVRDNGWYMLPGLGRDFLLPVAQDKCIKASILDVSVDVDRETRNQRFPLKSADCARTLKAGTQTQ